MGLTTKAPSADGARRRVPGTEPTHGDWFGFCGHYWTTGSCRGPFRLPRVDRTGRPVRPKDGRPVDDRGRLVNGRGQPVNEKGELLRNAAGKPLASAPRSRLCEDTVRRRYRLNDAVLQGSWYRCCDGQIRKLWDCCSVSSRRINGDASTKGYCRGKRKVFCVVYYDTGMPC